MTRRYVGSYRHAVEWFESDSRELGRYNWAVVSQNYVPGTWSLWAWVLAFFALVVLVGILILAYMIAARPPGELVVVYEYRPPAAAPVPVLSASAEATKVCPRCAETVKEAALVCRYCGHEFAPET
jgi:hypothetical protein